MANKLLLIKDVESLGRSGDIVSVRPGYSRNFLLPLGFAVTADKNALRMQARLQEERRQKALTDRKESEELAAALEGKEVSKVVKVDHEGHMYGSVSTADIVHLIQENLSVAVDKRNIQLKHAIKELGDHTIEVKLKEGVIASFKLTIIPDAVRGKTLSSKKEEKQEQADSSEQSE